MCAENLQQHSRRIDHLVKLAYSDHLQRSTLGPVLPSTIIPLQTLVLPINRFHHTLGHALQIGPLQNHFFGLNIVSKVTPRIFRRLGTFAVTFIPAGPGSPGQNSSLVGGTFVSRFGLRLDRAGRNF
uniref:(northern house mosquito) hypothetical protein n=1 Tax=Culex pipiens TaxID=7175 RepID=A0A8D8NVZ5_CULPI